VQTKKNAKESEVLGLEGNPRKKRRREKESRRAQLESLQQAAEGVRGKEERNYVGGCNRGGRAGMLSHSKIADQRKKKGTKKNRVRISQ